MDWKNNKKKQEIQKKQGEKILKEENPEYGSLYSMHGSKTAINEKLYEALLKDYLEEEGNHAVNGARISCEYMTDDLQNVKGEIFNEKSFDVDGQRLATVDDRVSLFEEKCSSIASGTEPAEESVNIYSMGNCGRILPIDYDWVLLNKEEAKKWGTCYCLMQLDEEWDNPPCVENAVDLVLGRDECGNVVQRYKNMIDRDFCNDATHQPITIGEDEDKIEGLTKMSVLFCKRKQGFITIEWSGQVLGPSKKEEDNFGIEYSYINKDGVTIKNIWNISDEMFVDTDTLTAEEITAICQRENPGLVERGFDKAIYELCQNRGLNPKVILATLGHEQSWCDKDTEEVYEKAFGVGPGGNPMAFSEESIGGLGLAVETYLKWYNYALKECEESGTIPALKVNYDPSPYGETKAVFKGETLTWQQKNSTYVKYMEDGMEVIAVNAAMYARLKYTPWFDFPPQNSIPLDTWLRIFNSLE